MLVMYTNLRPKTLRDLVTFKFTTPSNFGVARLPRDALHHVTVLRHRSLRTVPRAKFISLVLVVVVNTVTPHGPFIFSNLPCPSSVV